MRLAAAVCLVVVVVGAAAPAGADPAAPTDYRSAVESVEPAVEGLHVSIVGGDSFVRLWADGIDVVVLGYQGEPYLHFATDGVVSENQRSPAVTLNRDRFGTSSGGDPDAEPEWRVVARSGTYVWHDHRTHWMQPSPPLGRRPGDRILDGVVPLLVDGTPAQVRVTAVWLPAPSLVPAVLAAVAAAAFGAMAWRRHWRRWEAVSLLLAGLAAASVGTWQYLSLPEGTRPSFLGWLLPAVGVAAAGAALRARDRVTGVALLGLAAVELAVWAWLRRTGITRAVIPTDAPPVLDRAVTAATAALVLVVAGSLSWSRRRSPA